MSIFRPLASATANPLLVLTRLLIGLFLIWLGLTKVVPGWGHFDADATALVQALALDHIDGRIGLYVIGGLQILTGAALCVVPALELAVALLWLLLALYLLVVVFHLPALRDANGLPTLFAGSMLRNALLTIAGLAVASYSVKFAPPPQRK